VIGDALIDLDQNWNPVWAWNKAIVSNRATKIVDDALCDGVRNSKRCRRAKDIILGAWFDQFCGSI